MIFKNCHIYDETGRKEKNTNIIFSDKVVDITDILPPDETYISFRLPELTREKVNDINKRPDKYIIDLEGMTLSPGGIDAHVHFDTPGFTEREDFYHGSMSAAAGGITTVIDMPCTSLPPLTNGKNFEIKAQAIKDTSVVDYAFFGGVDAGNFTNFKQSMNELADRGVKGFKTYFISAMEKYPRVTARQFFEIMSHAKDLHIPVLLHAEDYDLLEDLKSKLKDDPDDYFRYYKSRPQAGETIAVKRAIEIAKAVRGSSLHVVHIASGCAALLLNQAAENNDITYETCPHYLCFTYHDFESKGTSLKTMPGVKDIKDRDMLWNFLKEGKCLFVTSDHAPASLKEKESDSFEAAYGGIPGTQTLIPVLYSEGVKKRGLSLKKFIEVTSENPAKRYGLYPVKGSLLKNSDADFTVIDPSVEWKLKREDLLSKGETSPFFGEKFTGKPVLTILRGKIIFADKIGITVQKGYGKYF